MRELDALISSASAQLQLVETRVGDRMHVFLELTRRRQNVQLNPVNLRLEVFLFRSNLSNS